MLNNYKRRKSEAILARVWVFNDKKQNLIWFLAFFFSSCRSCTLFFILYLHLTIAVSKYSFFQARLHHSFRNVCIFFGISPFKGDFIYTNLAGRGQMCITLSIFKITSMPLVLPSILPLTLLYLSMCCSLEGALCVFAEHLFSSECARFGWYFERNAEDWKSLNCLNFSQVCVLNSWLEIPGCFGRLKAFIISAHCTYSIYQRFLCP